MSSSSRKKVGILGATGLVGQRFIELLSNHPEFELVALAASQRSANQPYGSVVNWRLTAQIPQAIRAIQVSECDPLEFEAKSVDIVFSALDASVAGEIESKFARAGFPVFSNARNHRNDDDVPILIPYVNAGHIDIVETQRKNQGYGGKGFIVTNANCSSTGLAIALKPLQDAFGIEKVFVTTMQALSGAGYPGVASLDIFDNVIPHISGEEPKLESESLKILGNLVDKSRFEFEDFKISAHCNRVNVSDGHTECVSVELKRKDASLEDIKNAFKNFQSSASKQGFHLHSAPDRVLQVFEEENRPQPRLDRDIDGGYVVSVGRIRECPLLSFKFTILSHNTVIGAAGGSILNAELALAKGLI